MAIVPVGINGREYRLACDDGQEEQLVALAAEVDDRVRALARQMPHTNESMLLLLCAITLADGLADTRRTVRQLEAKLSHMGIGELEAERRESEERLFDMETAVAETLHDVAARIEKIALQMENGGGF